jgi:hypothetical protein
MIEASKQNQISLQLKRRTSGEDHVQAIDSNYKWMIWKKWLLEDILFLWSSGQSGQQPYPSELHYRSQEDSIQNHLSNSFVTQVHAFNEFPIKTALLLNIAEEDRVDQWKINLFGIFFISNGFKLMRNVLVGLTYSFIWAARMVANSIKHYRFYLSSAKHDHYSNPSCYQIIDRIKLHVEFLNEVILYLILQEKFSIFLSNNFQFLGFLSFDAYILSFALIWLILHFSSLIDFVLSFPILPISYPRGLQICYSSLQ